MLGILFSQPIVTQNEQLDSIVVQESLVGTELLCFMLIYSY